MFEVEFRKIRIQFMILIKLNDIEWSEVSFHLRYRYRNVNSSEKDSKRDQSLKWKARIARYVYSQDQKRVV